jgi:hypothetical protein
MRAGLKLLRAKQQHLLHYFELKERMEYAALRQAEQTTERTNLSYKRKNIHVQVCEHEVEVEASEPLVQKKKQSCSRLKQ